jgi:hypothetical protein
MVAYMLFLLLMLNPYLFQLNNEKANGLLILSVLMTSVLFPLISISLMKALDLIDSFNMEDKKERVGPMIVSILFYMWLFLNLKSNSIVPRPLVYFILGCSIALSLAFMINNFTKLSLHAMGVGGFVTALIFIKIRFVPEIFILNTVNHTFLVNTNLLLILSVIFGGLVMSARMSKNAHSPYQLYLGLIVGILSQCIGFNVLS